MESENSLEPDSTTLERDLKQLFTPGDDVLCLNNKDGCYYLGTIVQIDPVFKKCLIKYLDNTQTWSLFKDLKSFSFQETDNIKCVVCKKSQTKTDNEIIVCKCGRGYHRFCHQPKITCTNVSDWKCKRCLPVTKKIEEKSSDRVLTPLCSQISQQSLPTTVSQLPYNPDSLTWDAHHRINQEGYYCYCGGKGSWHMSMLQCRRCRQWFHAKCAPSVVSPVLCGDRFYVFICSLCNQGKEYCRRLAMRWADLVHLVLYNLTFVYQTKYYDLEESIMPYVNKNWDILKLPPWIAKANVSERRKNISNALQVWEKRFKSGRETKKRTNLWGLRFRGPPKPPPLTLPSRGPIDDDVLKLYCKKNFVISELEYRPLQNGHVNSSDVEVHPEEKTRTEQKIVPPLVINVSKPHSTCVMELRANIDRVRPSKETNYHGRGLVKRSTPFPVTDQSTNLDSKFRSQAVRRATRLLNRNKNKKSCNSDKSESHVTSKRDFANSFKEFVESREMNIVKVCASEPEVRKRPQRNLLEARLNSTESKLYNGSTVTEAEVKKPRGASLESKNVESSKKTSKVLVGNKKNAVRLKQKRECGRLVQRTIIESFKPKLNDLVPVVNKYKLNLSDYFMSEKKYKKCESVESDSSGDETSSRGTLEPIIPTPKDLEGRNNPFRNVNELLGNMSEPVRSITLPLPLKTVIQHADPPRLLKRKLSEKDIRIDRNGQVKRRRRHRRCNSFTNSGSKFQFTINGRRLRSRENRMAMTNCSPIKDTTAPVVDDLESSVKYLFGAASRIANGEKYEIQAKRVTKDGKVQCILEWIGGTV